MVEKAHTGLAAMHALQGNRVFPKLLVHGAVDKLFDEMSSSWGMKPEHKDDWVTTI